MAVADAWGRIVRWLSFYAPTTGSLLRSMADREDVVILEQEIGTELPDALIEWWSVCGGTEQSAFAEVIPPFYTPHGPQAALDAWRVQRKLWADTWDTPDCGVEAGSPGRSFHPLWVPFAFDGLGDALVIDLRPGELRGCVLEWDHELSQAREPEWTSIGEMLDQVATALEERSKVRHSFPETTTDGRLDWRTN
ncbi:hypothetical protein GCM10010174_10210 [Kutzneria viridogrisea]|uniref:Knr4/Smi1-like domain-containing protein n=2 Tax=Kutzneria TaxID=43356 RepID=W5WJK1_9PSEU|nr:SMI1/KNR4 family protein [Kutzneria albida]AHI01379.1 hypothetical protein KALB_8021 [Kutzneria albida DSM 43870]MBA8926629.1 cell wall assembly regulator SMI1 [Kutzneria viridogrisea]